MYADLLVELWSQESLLVGLHCNTILRTDIGASLTSAAIFQWYYIKPLQRHLHNLFELFADKHCSLAVFGHHCLQVGTNLLLALIDPVERICQIVLFR